ncbi:putative ATP-dependent RNA helicase [Venturia nashicola]|uniref:Putative ATP-dependent RNA helicase n=1 Tax=Venturia nashicola TaxID=86259 RepID=A0A4Z1P445_9PEZI|nr:putative ATP-dependent RNA helicase [Venturia nashicola]
MTFEVCWVTQLGEESVEKPRDREAVAPKVKRNFCIDHTEPREALEMVEACGNIWPFGKLVDGCEYLLIVVGAEDGL